MLEDNFKDIEIYHAGDGREAISALEMGEVFDLILLDWEMPVMDGEAFLKYVNKHKATDAKIIMVTTKNDAKYIKEALALGASEYIMKPFTKDILMSKISMVLIPKK